MRDLPQRGTTARRPLALAIAALFVGAAALPVQAADADRIQELERKLEQSLKTTEMLIKRIEQLEAAPRSAASTAPKADSASQDAKIDELKAQVAQLVTGMGSSSADAGLPLHGFADVGLSSSNRAYPKGFNIGKLDFYLAPQFTDRIKGLIEPNIEISRDGVLSIDLERLQLGYTVSDTLTAWMGRFHTPYGYWNTAYHHGAQIQTGVKRPIFLDFEDAGGILPAHTVGVWGTGAVKAGNGKLSYDAYAGNAPRIVMNGGTTGSLDPNLGSATNRNYMAGGNLGYTFGRGPLDGLKLGVHGYAGNVSSYAGDQSDGVAVGRSATRMLGAYAVYLNDDWEILSEYYGFRNRNVSAANDTRKSWAAYAQVGKQFGAWTPYARYERTSLDQRDLYFAGQSSGQSYKKPVLGLRYDLDPKSALKLEFDRLSLTDRAIDNISEVWLQFSVRF